MASGMVWFHLAAQRKYPLEHASKQHAQAFTPSFSYCAGRPGRARD